MKKNTYCPNMAAHLAYVQTQKHTRGDMARAVKGFNGKAVKRGLVDNIVASRDIHPAAKTETVGNTRYITFCDKPHRIGPKKIRVMKV